MKICIRYLNIRNNLQQGNKSSFKRHFVKLSRTSGERLELDVLQRLKLKLKIAKFWYDRNHWKVHRVWHWKLRPARKGHKTQRIAVFSSYIFVKYDLEG